MKRWKKCVLWAGVALVLLVFVLWEQMSRTQKVVPWLDARGYSEQTLKRFGVGVKAGDFPYNLSKNLLTRDILLTLTFNEHTVFPKGVKMRSQLRPEKLMELAKNPGLGVRELHRRGITGEGVKVAIIDQPLFEEHPEYKGKIVKYRSFGCEKEGSMHGPAVTSLLAGETIGTAPGVEIYYAAAASWEGTATYFAQALDWIVQENEALPEGDKIRLVSLSAAPCSSIFNDTEDWLKSLERAEATGLLVLDADKEHGLFAPAYFNTTDSDEIIGEEPEDLSPGWQNRPYEENKDYYLSEGYDTSKLCVPLSPRTVAEQYVENEYSYQYTGISGLSWGIPYAAGVLALGWEIDAAKSAEEMTELLFETAYEKDGFRYIYPQAFIEALEKEILK